MEHPIVVVPVQEGICMPVVNMHNATFAPKLSIELNLVDLPPVHILMIYVSVYIIVPWETFREWFLVEELNNIYQS